VIITPVLSGNFLASVNVTLSAAATAIVSKNMVVANLQCAAIENAVVFSLTFQERITYMRASDGAIITEAFAIPYANVLTLPGTVAGMRCEIAAVITALSVALTPPSTVTNNITFTITASTEFPPPAAQDVDSNTFTNFTLT
jgi:hypothetical protein